MIYSYINTRGNWENSKLCENTPPSGRRVSTQFLVFPISTYQHGKCFIFVKHSTSCVLYQIYTNSNGRREVVCLIQHGGECCRQLVKWINYKHSWLYNKQLLDDVFVRSTDNTYPTLIIGDIRKTEFNNCFIIRCIFINSFDKLTMICRTKQLLVLKNAVKTI